MAGSPRIVQALYRLYFGFWIPTLAWAASWWPLGLMYWMARNLVMLPFNILRPKYLRAVKGNYARVLGLPESHPRVRRAAWHMGWEHAYHWIDFFRWSQRPVEQLVANIDVEGEEHYHAARSTGRGTVLITAHMGNAEVGASGLGRHHEPIHLLYFRDRFATAEEFRNRMRVRSNVHGIPVDASPLSVIPALQVLYDNGVLAAHGDRDFNNQGWPFEFFGKVTTFPAGIFLLAIQADALIVPTYFLVKPDRRFLGIYEPAIETRGPGTVDERARAIMAFWLGRLEARIREYPEQWYCFYPFWREDLPASD